jgi:MYXO-CTERM domain-containing protein
MNAGEPGVAVQTSEQLELLAGEGSALWSVAAPSAVLGDLVPGQFDDDGIPDLAFQWGDPTNTLIITRTISGADGSSLWESAPLEPGAGRQPAGLTVGDFNDDGTDDVYFAGAGFRVLSGADGATLAHRASPGYPYALASLWNIDADPNPEIFVHGSNVLVAAYEHELSTLLWTATEDDRPYPYGAVMRCASGRNLLLTGSWQFPARLSVHELDPPNAGSNALAVFGGGRLFGDEAAAQAEGVFLGQLGSVVAHADLDGSGEPVALVGSTDGWLYAYSPCSATLRFAVDFGAGVGEVSFADSDGDGLSEILVSVADGYLYNLRQHVLEAPAWVWDTDAEHGITDRDVQEVRSLDQLSARWAEVDGATGYELALQRSDGVFMTEPRWQAVAGTELSLTGLSLDDGQWYYFVVRAVGVGGKSRDTRSDAVIVRFPVVEPEDEAEDEDTTEAAEPTEDILEAADSEELVEEPVEQLEAEDVDPADEGSEVSEPSPKAAESGCGCQSTRAAAPPSWLWLGLLGLGVVGLRRRRAPR